MKYKEVKSIDTVLPELDLSEEYFNTKALKAAVWQYLLDHSRYVDEGMFKFSFYIQSEAEFWRRVKARELGKFSRLELFDLHQMMDRKHKAIQKLRQENNKFKLQIEQSKNWEKRVNYFKHNGTTFQKLLLKVATHLSYTAKKLRNKALGVK